MPSLHVASSAVFVYYALNHARWLGVLYLPLYAFGIPVVRTLVWCVSALGLVMLFWAILFPS